MILRLLHPGSAGSGPLTQATAAYRKRIGHHLKTDECFVKAERLVNTGAAFVAAALQTEAERLIAKVGPRDRLVVLAVDGRPWTSPELAQRLQTWMSSGARAVAFALGSAHGLAPAVGARADETWSLSPLTLPHDLARVVLWEQLYRAGTILRGEPYHK